MSETLLSYKHQILVLLPAPRLLAVFLGWENPPPKLLVGGLG